MAEFEELRLTVNLVDDASTGLARIRGEIGQLTQSAGQMTTSLAGTTTTLARFNTTSQQTVPQVRALGGGMKALERSAYDAGRGLTNMATAVLQGGRALPMLGMGLQQAAGGVSGLAAGLAEIAPSAELAALAIGGIAIGVVGLGAAVAVYGVFVFKFAKEMNQLSQTAKAVGASFAEVKVATEHARQYGLSQEAAIQNLAGLQKAQTDLQRNNSRLRNDLVSKGLDPNWLEQYATVKDEWDASNMAREKALAIEQNLIALGRTPRAARGTANEFLQSIGRDPGTMDRRPMKPPTAAEAQELKRIAELSEKVYETWGKIDTKLQHLSLEVLSAGLPYLLDALKGVDDLFTKIGKQVEAIKDVFATVESWIPQWLKNVFVGMANGAREDGGNALRGMMNGPDGDPSSPTPPPAGRFDRFQPMNFRGSNDNNPLLQRANFTTEELVVETGKNTSQTEKLTTQLERLNGGGGVRGAGFGGSGASGGWTGAGAGAGGGGGEAGGGGGGSANMAPGDNAAGRAGIPNGRPAETGSEAVSSAQGGSDLDRGAFDKMFKGTPMEGKYDKVVEAAKANNVPPSLMAGVIAQETGKGTSKMLRERNNPAGLMDPKTGMKTGQTFGSVDEGIDAAGRTIAKNYARGGGTVEGMSKSYAPVGADNDPTGLNKHWTSGVSGYQQQLAAAPDSTGGGAGTKTASRDPSQGTNTSSGTASGGIPSKFGADVAAMTANGAGPKNIQDYLASHGVNTSIATCGQFMAQQVRLHGGTPPEGPAVASNWNNFGGKEGAGYSSDPNAINVAVKQGVRPGSTGSHVTAAIPIIENGKIVGYRGVGVNQGKQGIPGRGQYGRDVISSQRLEIGTGRNQYQIRHQIIPPPPGEPAVAQPARPAPDRPALDRSALSKPTEINATGKLSVDVNAPPGTKVEASGTGPFKETQLQRSTQMPLTQSGPSAEAAAGP